MTQPNLSRALLELYGEPVPSAEVIKLRGDASTRSYFRVRVANAPAGRPATVIAMQLPEDAFQSDEGGTQLDSQRLPFLEVAELLESKGLPVPSIYVEDLANRISASVRHQSYSRRMLPGQHSFSRLCQATGNC